MSKTDIETLRAGYDAFNRGDWDGVLEAAHPDLEMKTADRVTSPGTYRGPETIRRFFDDLLEPFEEVSTEPQEFFERGDQIVVFVQVRLRPKGSSAMVENRIGHLWTMRDGRALRWQIFPEREQALEAAGLSAQPPAKSRANLEAARAAYDAWSRGDLEAILTTLDEHVEFRTAGVFPGLDPVYRGHEGMRRFWEEFTSPWESLRFAIDHFRERDDQVVALYRFEAVGRDGLAVQREGANVITFRNGLALRIEGHGSWETALEAVGLSE